MQHVASLADLRLDRPAFVTIGAFDGVHRGHQALIGAMARQAHAAGQAAVVITFYPHPSVFLRGRRPSFYLSTPEAKAEYLADLGVDALVTHTFDAAFAAITAGAYVDQLRQSARLRELWCGPDFALGHNREGNVAYLQAAGARLGFQVNVQTPVLIDGEIISSTRIRQCLRDGAVEEAARALGRPFRVSGEVVAGAQRGRTIGIPTANLAVSEEHALPATGVYVGRVHGAAPEPVSAVANIGFRPTFNSAEPRLTLEAHLLDFSGDLYGRRLSLAFQARLRPEMKFPGVEALVAQIQSDIAAARHVLAQTPNL
ncbi:MAG: bifunctional riboflavin kinase/FAD synthetase [Anaerolineales bacterium]|nr:bifunctional riboflavin kinase/FAD synthetase [Anaerolineales bacterium]